MIEQGEALLAAGGLRRVLDGKAPTAPQVARSARLEDEARAAVESYLDGKHTAPPVIQGVDFPDELPEDAHGAVGELDGDVAVGYALAADRALEYLRNLVPRRPIPGLRARLADRNAGEKATLRRAWQVLEHPIETLRDLGAVSEDQIAAYQAVYPSLWSALGLVASEAMAKANRDLSNREERALGRILGVSVSDVASLQKLHAPEKVQTQGGAPPADEPPAGLATPMQELAAKQ